MFIYIFTLKHLRIGYKGIVYPIQSQNLWPPFSDSDLIQAPVKKRLLGRPKKHRKRGKDDTRPTKSSTRQCSKCGEFGYNARTCEGPRTRRQINKAASQTRPRTVQEEQCESSSGSKRARKRSTIYADTLTVEDVLQSQLTPS